MNATVRFAIAVVLFIPLILVGTVGFICDICGFKRASDRLHKWIVWLGDF